MERNWDLKYLVQFIDGSVEGRSVGIRAVHFINAATIASDYVQEKREIDPSIKDVAICALDLEENEVVF